MILSYHPDFLSMPLSGRKPISFTGARKYFPTEPISISARSGSWPLVGSDMNSEESRRSSASAATSLILTDT